ncbi:MAG: methylated-DNA--[protein]-cysteine S-methyltransferase [Clostridia bacterium]|nr:methylated-DNA--[protein]-cysteine S-methyltransferase [Clostridia bacterium]
MKKTESFEEFKYKYKCILGVLEIVSNETQIISIKTVKEHFENSEYIPEIINECVRQLDEYFSGKRKIFNLNINFSGTEFQIKVWKELLKIQYGTTISYEELSKRVGNIKACRAVGNANNKNKIMIVIPCHRVIGKNGNLVGYAGGLCLKSELLELEKRYL